MKNKAFYFEDFKISSDEKQFILSKRKIIKNATDKIKIGSEKWELIGYYNNLDSTFNRLANLICCKHIGELTVAIEKIDQLKKMIKNIISL